YAHAATTWLGPRRQAAVHLGLLLLPLPVLPIAASQGWVPPAGARPRPPVPGAVVPSPGPPPFLWGRPAPPPPQGVARARRPRRRTPGRPRPLLPVRGQQPGEHPGPARLPLPAGTALGPSATGPAVGGRLRTLAGPAVALCPARLALPFTCRGTRARRAASDS